MARTSAPMVMRDYAPLLSGVRPGPDRDATMRAVVEALWEAFSTRGLSWVGFYTPDARGESLILGARRDKPACSPLGLHGMCGRSFRTGRPIILRDAAAVDPGRYVACDPRDRSEVVVPLLDADGASWGVLDLDSHEPGTFDEADVAGLTALVERVGLSHPPRTRPETLFS